MVALARTRSHMKKEFKGTDGKAGAVSYWNGNKEVGEGEQEIKRIVENEVIETELRFLNPGNQLLMPI